MFMTTIFILWVQFHNNPLRIMHFIGFEPRTTSCKYGNFCTWFVYCCRPSCTVFTVYSQYYTWVLIWGQKHGSKVCDRLVIFTSQFDSDLVLASNFPLLFVLLQTLLQICISGWSTKLCPAPIWPNIQEMNCFISFFITTKTRLLLEVIMTWP